MKILFLYSEIAGYFLACAQRLHQLYGWEIHVVHWPVNPEAPFQFGKYDGIQFHDRAGKSVAELTQLYQELKPGLVYVSGWMDKGYVKLASQIRQDGIPVVCGSDNHWRGDLRQRLATLISPVYLKSRYTHLWVPGLYQYEFARRLGYPPSHILTGMYAADVTVFQEIFHRNLPAKTQQYPHNFLYVGRYVEIKGIQELCEAFVELAEELPNDWQLTLVGAGEMKNQLPKHERIRYQGFMQPEKLPFLATSAGCFVLPSRKEPWGVALHEFAAAGLPLITSTVCGAATAFVKRGYNGFLHEPNDKASLKTALQRIIQSSDEQLLQMGQRSVELSAQLSPDIWAHTLAALLPEAAAQSSTPKAIAKS